MCNYYANIYHYSDCKDLYDHCIHISSQGDPEERCNTGPHNRYVRISAPCYQCNPKQYYTSERRSTDDTPELQSPESSESEPDEPECDESDGLYGDACCEFDIAWNLPAALDGEDDKKIFLSETQTLTRTKDRVKVMMCQDYILEEHGDMGLVLLENIFSALQSPNNSYEDNSMEIRASYEMIYVLLPRHLCYLMDMLLWLCLSFVKADPGSVYISTAAISEESLTLMPLQPIEETDQHASKEYWHAMFDGVVIAQDPRLETQPCLWLELDFKLLEQLSRVTDTGVYDGGLLLTGPSSTLTPLQELDNYIVWKFDIVNVFEHGGLGLQTPWMRTRSLHQLRSKKALVSWYPQLRGMLLQTEHGSWVLQGNHLLYWNAYVKYRLSHIKELPDP